MTEKHQQPGFILPGAMKSGSSTLNAILDNHPGISMASQKESMFFDRTDATVHAQLAFSQTASWSRFSLDDEQEWEEYLDLFTDDDTLKGESSVSYMYSQKAPKTVTRYLDDPKAVFILRDPVERSYSHYWHQLRQTRTIYSFETSLKRDQGIFEYSIYPDKIQRWEDALGADSIKVILLEELIDQPQETMNGVFSFLGVDEHPIELPKKNPGLFPRFPRLYQFFNLLTYLLGKDTTTGNLRDDEYWTLPEKAFRKLILSHNKPEMDPDLRDRLERIFAHENEEMLEIKPAVGDYWDTFSRSRS